MHGLEGIRRICVQSEDLNEDFARDTGLTKARMVTKAELYLRKVSGITVVDYVAGAGDPVLLLGVSTPPIGVGRGYALAVEVLLKQAAYLERRHGQKPIWVPLAITWRTGGVATIPPDSGGGDFVLRSIEGFLDEFQREYLKANPDVKA